MACINLAHIKKTKTSGIYIHGEKIFLVAVMGTDIRKSLSEVSYIFKLFRM